MNNKIICCIIICLVLSSCSKKLQEDTEIADTNNGFNVCVAAPDFVSDIDTKSTLSSDRTFAWTAGDKIGLYTHKNGSDSQNPSQVFLTLSNGEGTSIAYSSTTGWGLIPGDTYSYFSYYPYSKTNTRDEITIDYREQEQTANNSTANLGKYDYMYSDMSTASSSSSASFLFHHIGCMVNMNITVPEDYNNTVFYQMRLYADQDIFAYSAMYSVDDIVESGVPDLDKEKCSGVKLSFGNSGIEPTDGVISAWMMMLPAQWSGKTITVKLYAGNNNVPTLSGTFKPTANQTAGAKYSYSTIASETGTFLPDKPVDGEQLHILLFGHSFGINCTAYLPSITVAAGIKDVHYGRWYQGNCSLAQHWGHITAKDKYQYDDSKAASGIWISYNRKVDDVLSKYSWDIILFQQSIGFSGEGSYSSYLPHLNYLTEYVTNYCETVHGKTPIIGWNMFWGYNENGNVYYDQGEKGALAMYQSIVQATKDMTADETKSTNIPLIVPSGTALQNARGTSLNDGTSEIPSTTKLLTHDGQHASLGIGQYVTACTWFQYMIAPIYGVDITGNTYRPTSTSFTKDLVTDDRAAICWECAIEAVNHPYEVTPIAK